MIAYMVTVVVSGPDQDEAFGLAKAIEDWAATMATESGADVYEVFVSEPLMVVRP